ncbi:MAG TPA: HIT family protein [Pseudomonas sp.]|jgi:diadenosine tetraphosphate (Ap4A) HIT family hydrolase|nr:HIT family protein [Pseudomonadales bacterium]MAQ50673.1 HIT family protein [Pseudomonas sp.]MBB50622.1 HIT family protein [Pseudomonadales bacterium]MBU31751.1 HIT family protein [Pseudomonadales bacterium]HCA23691.1 HIT family protein [Pseudomonas sp.]|tara:strand:- start:6742 stop:7173 length:432 start_codon:yes stop_codon:yes gene_type:complete
MFELHSQLQADCIPVGDFPLCRLLLLNDRQYPWLVLVPRRAELREVFELAEADRAQFHVESDLLAQVLSETFKADKMNVAALGNMVPQLHVHHIVRYRQDPAWPAPVWGKLPAVPYAENELADMLQRVRVALGNNAGFGEVLQ